MAAIPQNTSAGNSNMGARSWEYDDDDEDDVVEMEREMLQIEEKDLLNQSSNSMNGPSVDAEKKKKTNVVATPRSKRAKLTEADIVSSKGIHHIYETFPLSLNSSVKGNEGKMLRQMLKAYKQWAYALHPQLSFEDFLDRFEVLGRSHLVQTSLARLRQQECERDLERVN